MSDPFYRFPDGELFRTDGEGDTLSAVEYLAKWTRCYECGRRPRRVNPLPRGWYWDGGEFTTWAICPQCWKEHNRPWTDADYQEHYGCTEAEFDAFIAEEMARLEASK